MQVGKHQLRSKAMQDCLLLIHVNIAGMQVSSVSVDLVACEANNIITDHMVPIR